MTVGSDEWIAEVLSTGRIVQDDDASVAAQEAEARFDRYVALVDMVTGEEDDAVFFALLDSMTADDDYGAYQATLGAAFRFGKHRFGELLLRKLEAGFLRDQPDRAGDFLGQLAFQGARSQEVRSFNRSWAESDSRFAAVLLRFVVDNEAQGWLASSRQRGLLRPEPERRSS